jgi:hypothetical protein
MHLSGCPKTRTMSWRLYCISPYRGTFTRHANRNARKRCPQTPFQIRATAGALELPPAVSGNDTDFSEGVLPKKLRDSVAILEAPNPQAPGGKAKVYVLGLSHVSKRDCDLVSALIVQGVGCFLQAHTDAWHMQSPTHTHGAVSPPAISSTEAHLVTTSTCAGDMGMITH